MNIPVFLSYPNPHLQRQQHFIDGVISYLRNIKLDPRTLGVTDYNMRAPLIGIKELMDKSYGLVAIAFRRSLIIQGVSKPGSNVENQAQCDLSNKWLTTSYCQIEPAMAFQSGLPLLIFRESGVIQEGMLEQGGLGTYLPEFDLDCNFERYFKSEEWVQLIQQWEGCVRETFERKQRKQAKLRTLREQLYQIYKKFEEFESQSES